MAQLPLDGISCAGMIMQRGSPTPEELETLLEDTLLMRDAEVLAALLESHAILVTGGELRARGREQVARLALAVWAGDRAYIADPRCVLQAGDTALTFAEHGLHVMARDRDGIWRYAIMLLLFDDPCEGGIDGGGSDSDVGVAAGCCRRRPG
jgi:hypothetical protein